MYPIFFFDGAFHCYCYGQCWIWDTLFYVEGCEIQASKLADKTFGPNGLDACARILQTWDISILPL